MVRRNLWIVATVLVLGSVAATAMAQPGGGFGRGMFGGGGANATNLNLLQIAEVRTELAVTPDQQTKITDLISESRQKMQDAMSGVSMPDMQNATDEERQKFMTEMRKKIDEANKGNDEKVAGILNATQSKRLHELLLQRMGALALVLPTWSSARSGRRPGDEDQGGHRGQQQWRPQFTFDPNQSPEERQTAMQELQKKIQEQSKKTMDQSVAVLTACRRAVGPPSAASPSRSPPAPAGEASAEAGDPSRHNSNRRAVRAARFQEDLRPDPGFAAVIGRYAAGPVGLLVQAARK